MDQGVDIGPILKQRPIQLIERETLSGLMEKQVDALEHLLHETLAELAQGVEPKTTQDERLASHCAKRTLEDGRIDWTASGIEIDRLIRAVSRPYPGAFALSRGRTVKIWSAEPIDGVGNWFAAPGQVVTFVADKPAVRCADGQYLLLTDYSISDADDDPIPGARLIGQERLR